MGDVLEDDDLYERGSPMPTQGVAIDPAMLGTPTRIESANVLQLPRKGPDSASTNDVGWAMGLLKDAKGRAKNGLANVMYVFSKSPEWRGVLAYNAFTESVVKLKPPPTRDVDGKGTAGDWSDNDTTRAMSWFATRMHFEPGTSHVDQAVAATAERNEVHPVRDYLRSLKWDGVERLTNVLVEYFGTAATPYTRAIGPRYMISAVARVMQPGCQVDCTLVLESPQGYFKSTGFETLFGKDYFADTGLDIGDKDSYQNLRGKWCYELGELDSIKGKEATRVKNFLGARKDTYRPSYAKRSRDFQRQLVFCGTTNEAHYLADKTGNRRFWPVRCKKHVAIEKLRADRDQLWAEAMHRYQAGEAWHVDTAELRKLCENAQRAREIEDAWVAIVETWLEAPAQKRLHSEGFSTAAVLQGALELKPGDIHNGHSTRIGQVLRELGWAPKQQRAEDGSRARLYFPPPPKPGESQPAQPGADSGCDGEPE